MGHCVPLLEINQILTAARQALAYRVRRGADISSPHRAREYLAMRLGHLDHEVFGVIFVDKRHRVIEYVEMFRGTIDGASVYPREILHAVLERGAAAVVLVHNHPSGECTQSQADELITQRLKAALELIDVRVLDRWRRECFQLRRAGPLMSRVERRSRTPTPS
jgi:DNA repair protein RadC